MLSVIGTSLIVIGVANSDSARISFLGSIERELAQKLVPRPIIISVPRPPHCCWKGPASKPYVKLPPASYGFSRNRRSSLALRTKVRRILCFQYDNARIEAKVAAPFVKSLFLQTILYGYVRQSLDICIPGYRLPKQFSFGPLRLPAFVCVCKAFSLLFVVLSISNALRFLGPLSHFYVLLASHSTIRFGDSFSTGKKK